MVKRRLPAQHNTKLDADNTPPHSVLVERRRLGQTDLKAGPLPSGHAANLGVFDYAHLRVPLPQDLRKSGIFTPLKTGLYPESYFLMRRSSDGYISATGMYKAAFPWSNQEEEHIERRHHKSLPSGKGEEVAGNVWIAPEDGLKLAEEYNITLWILALLDNAPIEVGSKEKVVGTITSPPKFTMDKKLLPPPELSALTPRAQSKRSVSPAKSGTPRKIASPRKRRAASAKAEDKAEGGEAKAAAPKSSKALIENLENGVATSSGAKDDIVRVEVEEIVEKNKDTETVRTSVTVALPASHPDLPIPESTEGVIDKAKSMVEEGRKLEQTKAKTSKKRKASGNVSKEDVEASQSAKKTKTGLEEKLMTERVRTRALVGLTATLAISAIIPYFL